jgi:hypothetical protein
MKGKERKKERKKEKRMKGKERKKERTKERKKERKRHKTFLGIPSFQGNILSKIELCDPAFICFV